ncbi:hypothetical protein DFH06DRAFT_1163623 [Mycena polygramma]|nr:hypothetical protein DFH06DRAFT_1163623 [Mycena polygramma]
MTARKRAAKSTYTRTSPRLKDTALLLELPLDVLIEILKVAHPLSLLYLSRTNKTLRQFLLNRNNAFVWRESLEVAEGSPPQCPSYTSEIQWTRLLFEEVCHVCHLPLEHDYSFDPIWWEFGARYCSECSSTQVTKNLPREFTWSYYPYYSNSLGNHGIDLRGSGVLPCISGYYLVKDLDDFKAKYNENATQQGRRTLVEQRRIQTKASTDHAKVCRPWMEGIIKAHQDALPALRNARWADILAKFREAGWRDALISRSEWEDHSVVTAPRPLSGAEWRRIGPKLLKELRVKVKARVLPARFQTLNRAFPNLIKLTEHLAFPPSIADVALFPDVRTILESDFKSEVSMENLTAALQSKLPKLLEKWSAAFDKKLREHTRTVLELPSRRNVDPFKHALAYLVCENKCCQGYFTGHWKACRASFEPYYHNPAPETYEEFAAAVFRIKPSTAENMLTSASRSVLEDVIKHYGKDPKSATCEEMDAAPGKIYCMRCVHKNQPTGWRDAPAHSIKFHQHVSSLRARWEVDTETEE